MFDLARTTSAAHTDQDQFRSAVAALPPGPLRDVLTRQPGSQQIDDAGHP